MTSPDDPVDPDVDLHVEVHRHELRHTRLVIPAIAAGGAAGAALRHLAAVCLPDGPAGWPWSTLLVNLLGALAMGVVMGLLAAHPSHRGTTGALLRPFLGVGMLGGFTTMSAQAVGVVLLVRAGQPTEAAGYAGLTAVGTVLLAALGWRLTRSRRRRPTTVAPGWHRTPAAVGLVAAVAIATAVLLGSGLAGSGLAVGWVGLGAAAGAPLRYLTDRLVQSWHNSLWPWGTLTVNVLGSALFGALAAAPDPVGMALGVGFCGAYTTWSTTAHESAALLRQRHHWYGIGYPVASVVLCALAAAVGVVLLA